MIGYHVTTGKKIARYEATGCILPPVRFWPNYETAARWATRTGRDRILSFEVRTYYPLPDHKPAMWTPEIVYTYHQMSAGDGILPEGPKEVK